MSPNTTATIIHNTISRMKSYHSISKVDEYLVALTFLMETDCYNAINKDNALIQHGFMKMSKTELGDLIFNHLRIYPSVTEDIFNVSMVDIMTDSLDAMFDALCYNVAFQSIITWCFYRVHLGDMPKNIEEVVHQYFYMWKKDAVVNVEDVEDATDMLIGWIDEAERNKVC